MSSTNRTANPIDSSATSTYWAMLTDEIDDTELHSQLDVLLDSTLHRIKAKTPSFNPLATAVEIFQAQRQLQTVVKLVCCVGRKADSPVQRYQVGLIEQTSHTTSAWLFNSVPNAQMKPLTIWFQGRSSVCPLTPHQCCSHTVSDSLRDVWLGNQNTYWHHPAEPSSPPDSTVGLLSGSFNPLHAGHQELRKLAEQKLKGPVHYELPLENADKPPLDYLSIQNRLQQFGESPVLLSRAATFVEKSNYCRNQTFVVGADTAVRICDARFYGTDLKLKAALDLIAQRGCCFLVAPRKVNGQVLFKDNIELPDYAASLFDFIHPEEFCLNISSTELRRETGLFSNVFE